MCTSSHPRSGIRVAAQATGFRHSHTLHTPPPFSPLSFLATPSLLCRIYRDRKTGVKLHQVFHMHTLTALSNWETGFETPPNHRIINVWAWSDLFSSIGPWNLTHLTGLQSLCHGRYVLRFRQRGTWSFSHSARQCSVGFLVWIIACILWRGEKFHLHSMELRWESIA